MHSEETELVRRSLAGDPGAFSELADRYERKVYAVALAILRNHHDANDAVSESFLRAWSALATFDTERKFSTWLLAIATNYCRDQLKKKGVRETLRNKVGLFFEIITRSAAAGDILDRETEAEWVRNAVAKLPLKYREALVLAYFGDYGYKDIADTLGISVTNVETRIYRAKKLMREMIREEMDR